MNWPHIITQILSRGYQLREVAALCHFSSPGHLHDLKSGKQLSVEYERGAALLDLHRKVMRRRRVPS